MDLASYSDILKFQAEPAKHLKPSIPRRVHKPKDHLAKWYRDDLIFQFPTHYVFELKQQNNELSAGTECTLKHNEK